MEQIKRVIRILLFFVKLFTAYVCASILKSTKKQYRNLWIVSERGNDARDNGFFFYRYLRKEHPEINVVYSISSSSADFPKVSELGRWVEYGSFKHYVVYEASVLRISSSMWGGDLPEYDYFFKIRKLLSHKRKFVFLKHGIVKDYLPQHCIESGSPDLYICGAKPEYEYVEANFGHPEGTVKYTGLARFDNLHSIQAKKQILIMPTFRTWLQASSESEMKRSKYVETWNAVLNDRKVHDSLKKHDLKLVFYPHHVFQRYINLFTTGSENITIAKFKDYDVQTLLIESKLLITDYSSVFFDFAYMNKPVIYYQFDREEYIKKHYDYTKGYFDYERDGFGPVVIDHKELVDCILKSVENCFTVNDEYLRRIEAFFPINDTNNCKRIYEETMRLMG